jgi:preprotein translocase subunit SecD
VNALARLVGVAPLLALACASPAADEGAARADGTRMTFVLEVDRALAREQVWLLRDASDEQVVTVAMNAVRRRLDAMARSVELRHAPGSARFEAVLPAGDPMERELLAGMLRSLGLCELFFVADDDSAHERGIDLADERARFDAWRATNPEQPVELFNGVPREAGGAARGISWITAVTGLARSDVAWPVLLPERPADHVGATSFARVWPAVDATGAPALGFALRTSRTDDLARITEARAGARLALVLLGRLISAPTVKPEVVAAGILEGRFTPAEVERYARTIQELRSPITVVSIR